MRKLIISELKKMLKSKFHLSLLIFVIVMMVVQIVREDYRAVNAYEPDLQFSTFDGEPLNTNRDLYVYADQIYSQYEGTVNEELWQRFMDDYNHLYTEFTKDENIDAVKMTNFYGEDWKALFERNERQKLTDKDHQLLQRLNESNADYVSVVYDELSGQEPDQYLLKTFYKDESSLNTLNLIYRGSTDLLQEEPLLSDKSPQQNPWNYPLYCLLHPQTMLIDQLNLSYSENGIPSHQQTNLQLYAEKQLSQPQTYGSMIPARLFVRHMQSNTMITIVILAILFANTFAIEKSTKMDQLIVATKAGYTRITIDCGRSLPHPESHRLLIYSQHCSFARVRSACDPAIKLGLKHVFDALSLLSPADHFLIFFTVCGYCRNHFYCQSAILSDQKPLHYDLDLIQHLIHTSFTLSISRCT